MCISIYWPMYIPTSLPTYMRMYLHTYAPTYVPTYLFNFPYFIWPVRRIDMIQSTCFRLMTYDTLCPLKLANHQKQLTAVRGEVNSLRMQLLRTTLIDTTLDFKITVSDFLQRWGWRDGRAGVTTNKRHHNTSINSNLFIELLKLHQTVTICCDCDNLLWLWQSVVTLNETFSLSTTGISLWIVTADGVRLS